MSRCRGFFSSKWRSLNLTSGEGGESGLPQRLSDNCGPSTGVWNYPEATAVKVLQTKQQECAERFEELEGRLKESGTSKPRRGNCHNVWVLLWTNRTVGGLLYPVNTWPSVEGRISLRIATPKVSSHFASLRLLGKKCC